MVTATLLDDDMLPTTPKKEKMEGLVKEGVQIGVVS